MFRIHNKTSKNYTFKDKTEICPGTLDLGKNAF